MDQFDARIAALRSQINSRPQRQQPQPVSSTLFRDQSFQGHGSGYGGAATYSNAAAYSNAAVYSNVGSSVGYIAAQQQQQMQRMSMLPTGSIGPVSSVGSAASGRRMRQRRRRQQRREEESYNTLMQTAGYVLKMKQSAAACHASSDSRDVVLKDKEEALMSRLDLVLHQNAELQSLLLDQAGSRSRYRERSPEHPNASSRRRGPAVTFSSPGGSPASRRPRSPPEPDESYDDQDSDDVRDQDEHKGDASAHRPRGLQGIDLSAKDSTAGSVFEGGSEKLSEASTWFAQRMNPSDEIGGADPLAATVPVLSESDEEDGDADDDADGYRIEEFNSETSQANRREMRAEIKKKLGIMDLIRPRWRTKEGDEPPHPEALMKGKMLFRSIALVPKFIRRLEILVRNASTAAVLSDQKDVAEFMGLYRDLSKNWLASLVKVPVLSVIKNRTLNLNIEGTKGAKASLSKLFSRGSSKDAKKNMLMQCKVRVKGIIDILLSACRVNNDQAGAGSSKGIPRKLCEFFAKYFVSDGIAFPDGYLWLSEENKLEFAKVGTERVTRRMVFRDAENALEDSMKSQPDGEEDEHESDDLLQRTKASDINTERPRILITNFLLGRVLCENVLLQPSTCLALAGGKEISAKSKRNLQYIASMIYLILTKLHDDLPPPNGQAMDINTSNNTSRAKGPEDLKKRIGASGKSVVASSTEGQNNPDVFTVTFIDGPLGLDLQAHLPNGNGAVIHGISDGTQADKKRRLIEGQTLLKLGNRKVEHIQFARILALLRKIKRPIRLTFREHLSGSKWVDEISVPFPAGPLGLDLSPGAGNVGTVVALSKLGALRPGDLIAKVGKQVVADFDMEETIKRIQEAKRPVKITFFRKRDTPKEIQVDQQQAEEIGEEEKKATAPLTKQQPALNEKGKEEPDDGNESAPSQSQWSTSQELAKKSIALNIFNQACDPKNKSELSELEDWIDTQADRIDMWSNAIISEVMNVARDMQKKKT